MCGIEIKMLNAVARMLREKEKDLFKDYSKRLRVEGYALTEKGYTGYVLDNEAGIKYIVDYITSDNEWYVYPAKLTLIEKLVYHMRKIW